MRDIRVEGYRDNVVGLCALELNSLRAYRDCNAWGLGGIERDLKYCGLEGLRVQGSQGLYVGAGARDYQGLRVWDLGP